MLSNTGKNNSINTVDMQNIILNKITVEGGRVYYDFYCDPSLTPYFNSTRLFIEYPNNVDNVPMSILAIPFVGTILGIAWLENCNIYVPELDSTYYYSLRETRAAYQDMYYDAKLLGRVVPCKIISNELPKSNKSLLLFGGGVDAHSTYIRHKSEVSHIINIQGWFKDLQAIDIAAECDKKHCKEFAIRENIEFIYVKSNFASLIDNKYFEKKYSLILHDSWWHGIQHSMAFIAISIVMAYRIGISNLLIASSCTVGRRHPCASFITTDSSYRFSVNGNVTHDAFELNRQQKMKVIVDYQKKSGKPYPLKVCSFNDKNCCECEKCFRTILEIVAEGGDVRDFGFNIDGSLTDFFKDVMNRRLALWGVDFEYEIYWKDSFKRMKENLSNISQPDFVEWVTNYDFRTNKKIALRNYYRSNFLKIIRRKLGRN